MKHYKTPDQSIWAFEPDGSQDHLITPDMTPVSDAALFALRNPPKTPEQIVAEFTAAIQQRLDDFAKTRGYDSILSACTYATSTVPKFAAEGQHCVDARDATWRTCYAILEAVQTGARPMPTLADIEAELPALEWPA